MIKHMYYVSYVVNDREFKGRVLTCDQMVSAEANVREVAEELIRCEENPKTLAVLAFNYLGRNWVEE